MPKTLIAILTGLVAVVTGWAPTTSLVNDLADGALLLLTAHTALPSNPVTNLLAKYVNNLPAELTAVEHGSIGILGSEPISVNGEADEIMFFAVRKYVNSAPPAGSLAALIKEQAGT